MARSTITPISDFKSSIQPLLTWMRILGIDLDWQSSNLRKYAAIIIGAICFVFNVSCYTCLFVDVHRNLGEISATFGGANSSTFSLHIIFDYINVAVPSIGVHLSLLVMAISLWPAFYETMHSIECQCKIDPESYKQVKRLAYLGIAYAIGVKGYLFALQIYHDFLISHISTPAILLNIFSVASQIYPATGLAFSCTVCWMLSLRLKAIHQDIDRFCDGLSLSLKSEQIAHQIRKWNRLHYQLSDAVDRFNRCFGYVFLFNVTFTFTGTISTAFILYMSLSEYRPSLQRILMSSFFLEHLCNLLIMSYVSDCLKCQSHQVVRSLRRLRLSIPPFYDQEVHMLMNEIAEATPSVRGLGFFEINQKLFPTLIGTALTYVIILCQFRVSEQQTVPK